MAALTSSNVRTIAAWTEGALTGKRRSVRQVEVYGGTWGGTTNTMPASAFGLSVIEEATPGNYGNTFQPSVPASDGSVLHLYAASQGSPADLTVGTTPGGLYITVKGY